MSEYFIFAVALGLPAYVLAVIRRRVRQARETRQRAADCLAVAVARTDYHGFDYSGTLPGSDSDRDDHSGAVRTTERRSGRRAIYRDNGGPRLGRYAAGRDIRSADAEALA